MASVATIHSIGGARSTVPENIEAEAVLLGALLIENPLVAKLAGKIGAEDFYEPVHARVFTAIKRWSDEGKQVNATLLRPEFEADEGLSDLGGTTYLFRLTADDSGLLAPFELAEQIRDLANRRRTIAALEDAVRAYRNTAEDAPLPDLAALLELPKQSGATFELLSLADLEAMPPPQWLVHETIAQEGLTTIYGDPGAGKSFIALDMALRIAQGMNWHGVRTRRTGVLYIAGEGARGIGKRVTGWRISHGLQAFDAPFMLLPVAVQMTDDADRTKLLRTIDAAKKAMDCDVGLVVIDTVSRAIAGVDENSQETMSAFIRACDQVKEHTGGALIGIHHSGKDKERGMRGSSVLLGGVDASIKLTKDNGLVTLLVEKQKDGEDGQKLHMRLERIELDDEISTLVPVRADAAEGESGAPSYPQIVSAFTMMADAWEAGKPLSSKVQTREAGRYAPMIFAAKIGGNADEWRKLLDAWLAKGIVTFEMVSTVTKMSGLRVIDAIT